MSGSAETLGDLLALAADATPDAPAVIDGGQAISYAELDRRANAIAHVLREFGVGRHDRVPIYAAKSVEAVAAQYAVMKLGAAYVPIDPSAPEDRVARICDDCDAAAIILDARRAARAPRLRLHRDDFVVLVLDDLLSGATGVDAGRVEIDSAPTRRATSPATERDVAFLLYTSGSTGTPKGVTLTHRNALAFIRWAAAETALTADDRLSSVAPFHFDLSVFDLYAAALAGARVVLLPTTTAKFPVAVKRFIQEHEITVWYSVPSILIGLLEHAGLGSGSLPSLRTVVFAGEVFPPRPLHELMTVLPGRRFLNWFGPTETNVCTSYEVPEPPSDLTENIPIGKAIAGVEVFAVDEDGERVGPGDEGELMVTGPTVMAGYWNDPDRTALSFALDIVDYTPGPVYRTGDIVMLGEDGNWHYRGRRDDQVKLRGYRIELGDVEAALASHQDVTECAVRMISGSNGEPELAVWFVATADESLLRRHMAERLPKYMVPTQWRSRESLPRTSTGKLDRRSLEP